MIILVLGIVFIIASFIIPVKKEHLKDEIYQLSKEQLNEILKQEIQQAKEKMEAIVEETVAYSIEKSERALERLTNEKIMAVDEYSHTVLDEIKRNHEEVIFLYEMLNDKQKNIKNTVVEVEKTVKAAEKKVQSTRKIIKDDFIPIVIEKVTPLKEKPKKESSKNALPFSVSESKEKNNNEKILEFHQQGKSNVTIAKELGLGIGEVKLVIDLFKGM